MLPTIPPMPAYMHLTLSEALMFCKKKKEKEKVAKMKTLKKLVISMKLML
jgi:hypothetical protein